MTPVATIGGVPAAVSAPGGVALPFDDVMLPVDETEVMGCTMVMLSAPEGVRSEAGARPPPVPVAPPVVIVVAAVAVVVPAAPPPVVGVGGNENMPLGVAPDAVGGGDCRLPLPPMPPPYRPPLAPPPPAAACTATPPCPLVIDRKMALRRAAAGPVRE